MRTQFEPGETRRSHTLGAVIVGLVIVTFGLTLLANNLGWADAHWILRQLWPLGLIVLGVATLLQPNRGRGVWGVMLVLGGLWVYASQQHWLRVNPWAIFGPTLIVLLGGSLIWRAFNRPRPADAGPAFVRTFAIMSGSEIRPTGVFRGADLNAFMGGVKLDLTAASMEGDSATVDVFAFMGGMELYVPRDWHVTVEAVPLMGAVVDKRRPATLPPTKQLIVRGFAVMGGVEIKD